MKVINRITTKLNRFAQLSNDSRAAAELSRLGLPYLPWSDASLLPSALQVVLNEIEINSRKTIVEFGSGISTIYVAQILSRLGGRIVSFESDLEWATFVENRLAALNLAEFASVVHAPLGPCTLSKNGLQWYDPVIVTTAVQNLSIDCVVVDGPPAYSAGYELARYPALPAVQEWLAQDYVVFLDDIHRLGEQEILRLWANLFGIKFLSYFSKGNIARGIHGVAQFVV
ncbi:class I SAM-dependent methyltransferase [Mesorhizobium sp. LMG 17147]|uniref:class I SAM-dependent methyltransferase n=1 Tax=Mesorhizobium sp. LMG 17147 TaxID=2963091 RepID=UPI0020C9A887|nr:class I SAM-dependent methyltransferase [Mesorhizobium sp. LMG 17147]MCP9234076.1 class I SAM-dependent methyltransferase [Mesorhizobium sp. LMG 17147]